MDSSLGGATLAGSARLEKFPDFDSTNSDDWRRLLTNGLRENFESKGTEIVRQELMEGRYEDVGKRFAAMAWLKEKAEGKERLEKNRFRWAIALAAIAAITGLISATHPWIGVWLAN